MHIGPTHHGNWKLGTKRTAPVVAAPATHRVKPAQKGDTPRKLNTRSTPVQHKPTKAQHSSMHSTAPARPPSPGQQPRVARRQASCLIVLRLAPAPPESPPRASQWLPRKVHTDVRGHLRGVAGCGGVGGIGSALLGLCTSGPLVGPCLVPRPSAPLAHCLGRPPAGWQAEAPLLLLSGQLLPRPARRHEDLSPFRAVVQHPHTLPLQLPGASTPTRTCPCSSQAPPAALGARGRCGTCLGRSSAGRWAPAGEGGRGQGRRGRWVAEWGEGLRSEEA